MIEKKREERSERKNGGKSDFWFDATIATKARVGRDEGGKGRDKEGEH